jgi:hypothetical protein
MKKVLLTAVATLSLATATIAQTVPNYVPTNGLVGWWPFNGNANDESGNGNNGTVNGATLTADRNGIASKAYSFDGINDYINVIYSNLLHSQEGSINVWIKTNDSFNSQKLIFGQAYGRPQLVGNGLKAALQWKANDGTFPNVFSSSDIGNGQWIMLTGFYSSNTFKIYVNGILENVSITNLIQDNCSQFDFQIGGFNTVSGCGYGYVGYSQMFNGLIDDIGIWNRALTQQEITNLYNSVNCNNNLAITPQTNTLQIGNTATFNATTSDANPTCVWQSDFGQGFQTLNNYGNYSGVNTNTLSIANVQLANHNQPIRAISTSGNCIDTSNVAYINIADTCITTTNETIYDTTFVTVTDTNYVTVYDTVTTYISVTDTLFINVNTVGLNNNTIVNTIKVFPNPANSNLNLDFGNFNNLNGYSIKIYNSLSQVIYNQAITQQSETIDLSTFGGNGIYFLHVINAQNNTVEIRKIVLQ